MAINTMDLIEYFAHTTIEFRNAFKSTLPAGKIDTKRRTSAHTCGIIIPIKGAARFSLDGVPYMIHPNTIVHAGANMEIEIKTFEEDWTYAVIHYEVMHIKEQFEPFAVKHFSIEIDQMQPITTLLQQLLQKNMNPDSYSYFELKVIFMNLLQAILNGARNSQYNIMIQHVNLILEYFHLHYEEDFLISEVADKLSIDRRRISYLFEKVTGMTPIQYLTKYRITKAKELLTISDLTISEISNAVGYQDSFYFSRVFKNHTTLSPSQYRKQTQCMT